MRKMARPKCSLGKLPKSLLAPRKRSNEARRASGPKGPATVLQRAISRTKRTRLEDAFEFQLKARKIDSWAPWDREYRFHPTRRWRFDFAWPQFKLAVEIQGGTFQRRRTITGKDGTRKIVDRSGHTSGVGIHRDLVKQGEAMRLGWNVYACDTRLVQSGEAAELVEAILKNLSGQS